MEARQAVLYSALRVPHSVKEGRSMATRVGFIGLGNIGKPMAMNVARAGFDLMVYDLREEPLKELAGLGASVARAARDGGGRQSAVGKMSPGVRHLRGAHFSPG